MQVKLIFSSVLLSASSFAAAAPAINEGFASFQLKTIVTAGNKNKNDLYVQSYHTGAGTADAVLAKVPTNPALVLNDTAIQFNYGSNEPAYLNMQSPINYAAWDSVTINQAFGPTYGFYFNNSVSHVDGLGVGLKWNPNYPNAPPPKNDTSEFGGWLACDWSHQVPQLFWVVRNRGRNNTLIDTCSQVELVRV